MEQNTPNTALLVMDMQAGIVAMLPDTTAILGNVSKAIATARSKNIPVIYVEFAVLVRGIDPHINQIFKSHA